MSSATISEIVTFCLIEGAEPKAFAQAAKALTPMLANTKGALSRCLSCDDGGLWTDHITWSTLDAAKETADKIMSDPAAAPMMSLIDPATVTLRHARIYHLME